VGILSVAGVVGVGFFCSLWFVGGWVGGGRGVVLMGLCASGWWLFAWGGSVVVMSCAVFAGLVVGLWFGGWWFGFCGDCCFGGVLGVGFGCGLGLWVGRLKFFVGCRARVCLVGGLVVV